MHDDFDADDAYADLPPAERAALALEARLIADASGRWALPATPQHGRETRPPPRPGHIADRDISD